MSNEAPDIKILFKDNNLLIERHPDGELRFETPDNTTTEDVGIAVANIVSHYDYDSKNETNYIDNELVRNIEITPRQLRLSDRKKIVYELSGGDNAWGYGAERYRYDFDKTYEDLWVKDAIKLKKAIQKFKTLGELMDYFYEEYIKDSYFYDDAMGNAYDYDTQRDEEETYSKDADYIKEYAQNSYTNKSESEIIDELYAELIEETEDSATSQGLDFNEDEFKEKIKEIVHETYKGINEQSLALFKKGGVMNDSDLEFRVGGVFEKKAPYIGYSKEIVKYLTDKEWNKNNFRTLMQSGEAESIMKKYYGVNQLTKDNIDNIDDELLALAKTPNSKIAKLREKIYEYFNEFDSKKEWDKIKNLFREIYFVYAEDDEMIYANQVKAEEYKWFFDRYSSYPSSLSWKDAKDRFLSNLTEEQKKLISYNYNKQEYGDLEEHDEDRNYITFTVKLNEKFNNGGSIESVFNNLIDYVKEMENPDHEKYFVATIKMYLKDRDFKNYPPKNVGLELYKFIDYVKEMENPEHEKYIIQTIKMFKIDYKYDNGGGIDKNIERKLKIGDKIIYSFGSSSNHYPIKGEVESIEGDNIFIIGDTPRSLSIDKSLVQKIISNDEYSKFNNGGGVGEFWVQVDFENTHWHSIKMFGILSEAIHFSSKLERLLGQPISKIPVILNQFDLNLQTDFIQDNLTLRKVRIVDSDDNDIAETDTIFKDANRFLICKPKWDKLIEDVLKESDTKNVNDWLPAKKSTDCKSADSSSSPYSARYMYSPSLDKLRYQNEGEWYGYGSVSDTFSNGGGIITEISKSELESKVGRKLDGWNDDVVYYNGQKYKKCFLRPHYKIA